MARATHNPTPNGRINLKFIAMTMVAATMAGSVGCEDTADRPRHEVAPPTESTAQVPAESAPAHPPKTPAPIVSAPPAPTWTADTQIGQIVADQPATARIFELANIDYCCGGNKTLLDACAEAGVDAGKLLAALLATRPTGESATERNWQRVPLTELLDHIEATHHEFLKRELPRLAGMMRTVLKVHGAAHAELAEVAEIYHTLHTELAAHLETEETQWFPAIRNAVPSADPALTAGIRHEHDRAGEALHRLHELTNGFAPPEDACNLYRALLDGLAALAADTHTHVHLENNVLIPRLTAGE